MGAETHAQLLARLIESGGKILVVGGGITDHLPDRFRTHPAILIWDDNRQESLNKEVPGNVKAILWNRWISHKLSGQLNTAVEKLRILKFPMLRTREIKELLGEIVQADPLDATDPIDDATLQSTTTTAPFTDQAAGMTTESSTGDSVMAKSAKRGTLNEFIATHLSQDRNWSERGTISREGKRIYQLAKQSGIPTTENSVQQGVRVLITKLGMRTPKGSRKKTVSAIETVQPTRRASSEDDFQELDKLIADAIAAMKLVQEHIPKVRKEVEKLRGAKAKVLQLFGDGV